MWSRGGRLGRVLALVFYGQLVKKGLGAGSLFAVDGGERLRHFFGELGRVDNARSARTGTPTTRASVEFLAHTLQRHALATTGVRNGDATALIELLSTRAR